MDYQAIIVLAGGIKDNGELHQSVKNRIHKAKELFDQGVARTILMSGKHSLFRRKDPLKTEAESMVEYATKLGVPKSSLLTETNSNNTLGNAFYVIKHFIQPKRWSRVIIVTSNFHMPRVKYIFQKFLGQEHQVMFVPVETPSQLSKWFKRQLGERLALLLTRYHFRKYKQGDFSALEKLFQDSSRLEISPFYSLLTRLTSQRKTSKFQMMVYRFVIRYF